MKTERVFRKAVLLAVLLVMMACNLPTVEQPPALPTVSGPVPPAITPVTATTTPFPAPTQAPTATQTRTPTATVAYQPVFQPAACAFDVPAGQRPFCGYLIVPENRDRARSPWIRLHVAVFRSTARAPAPDPVVYLAGGPGSAALDLAQYLFSFGMDRVLATRDLVLFDQRGTGYSQPRLDCPERHALTAEILDRGIAAPQNERAIVEAFNRCRERLLAQGADLAAYTSAASAADLADLAAALHYPRLNLYAVSYGTRLALTALRDQPGLVRSAVLDSVYPPQADLYTALAPNANRAFEAFFAQFASSHPTLREDFYNLVDELNARPQTLRVNTPGGPVDVRLDGGLLIDVLFVGLYNPAVTARMPDMIYGVAAGDTTRLRERVALYFDPSPALGMQMAVQCAEEIPFGSMDEAQARAAELPPQIAAFYPATVRPLYTVCASWSPAAPDPRENQAVTSHIPALILAGSHDPITPPEWGQMVSADLSESRFELFEGHGHWVTRSSQRALQMALDFWNEDW